MSRVLVLNASYEPLTTVSSHRAILMLLAERAFELPAHKITMRSALKDFSFNSVLLLKRYVNVPRRNAIYSRRAVLSRDDYTCIFCGKFGDTIDHIIPQHKGGKDTWGNTAACCFGCNQLKGDREPHEAGLTMLYEPKIPRSSYLVVGGKIPKDWKIYLER